jgi:hydroxymethylbilane synthase
VLDPAQFVPAPGQGTLALESRGDDRDVTEQLAAIVDRDAFTCLLAERALARALDADCHTPLGAHAAPWQGRLRLRAWLGLADDRAFVSDELLGDAENPQALGCEVAERISLVRGVAAG